jgi:hypothetical protein
MLIPLSLTLAMTQVTKAVTKHSFKYLFEKKILEKLIVYRNPFYYQDKLQFMWIK